MEFIPKGVCAQLIEVELDGDKVGNVRFTGGCNGNLKAISRLVKGMEVDEVIRLLEGNTCGRRNTSCADQLTIALRKAKEAQ
jgi:uncharacterized protein (TIGR03905 family)